MFPCEIIADCFFKLLFVVFALIFVFIIPMIWVYKEKYKQAGLSCLFALLLLITLNIDKVQTFKFGILEADLKKTIENGQATIQQLKKVALALAERSYSEIALSGSIFTAPNPQTLLKHKMKIDEALRNIGANSEEINKASHIWSSVTSRQMILLIFRSSDSITQEEADLWKNFIAIYWDKEENVPPNDLKKFLEDNNLVTDLRKSRLKDYEHFYVTNEVLDASDFQMGRVPLSKDFVATK